MQSGAPATAMTLFSKHEIGLCTELVDILGTENENSIDNTTSVVWLDLQQLLIVSH